MNVNFTGCPIQDRLNKRGDSRDPRSQCARGLDDIVIAKGPFTRACQLQLASYDNVGDRRREPTYGVRVV